MIVFVTNVKSKFMRYHKLEVMAPNLNTRLLRVISRGLLISWGVWCVIRNSFISSTALFECRLVFFEMRTVVSRSRWVFVLEITGERTYSGPIMVMTTTNAATEPIKMACTWWSMNDMNDRTEVILNESYRCIISDHLADSIHNDSCLQLVSAGWYMLGN